MKEYLLKVFDRDFWISVLTGGGVAVFTTLFGQPTEIFKACATALLVLVALDWAVKVYMVCQKHGGFKQARRQGKIASWLGTKKTFKKVVKYATIIVAGNQIAVVLRQPPYLLENIANGWMVFIFFALCMSEAISIFENLDYKGDDKALNMIKDKLEDIKDTIIKTDEDDNKGD